MKNKAYTVNLLLAAILQLGFSSCEKSLNLTPKDQVSDASFWKTPGHFKLAANDFYYGLQGAPQYIDRNSDIAFGNGSDPVSNGSYLAPENSETWDNAYTGIRANNYLLLKAEESEITTEITPYVGEALFFRAYNYWNLVRNFGGVPIVSSVLDVDSPELYQGRATQEEVIAFILEDLEQAVSKLPLHSQLEEADLGRVTRGAALALTSRVALYQGTWEKYHQGTNGEPYLTTAITASKEIIDSGEYGIYMEKGADSYKYLFIQEGDDSNEVILAKRYYANRITHNWTRELWFNQMIPTKNLADTYLATDGLPIEQSDLFEGYGGLSSEFLNRDPRMRMTFIVPGSEVFSDGGEFIVTYPGFTGTNATRTGYMLRKFLDETIEATQFQGAYDLKEFRYAEVLLNLAEALFERDGQISDADLNNTINVLRNRVEMPAISNSFITANGLDMKEEIRRERTVELAFEGFRRMDLRRWKTAENVLPEAIEGVKFEGTAYEENYPDLEIGVDVIVDSNGFIITEPESSRQFLSRHYLDPIPLQQIQLSKGTLDQNEGW